MQKAKLFKNGNSQAVRLPKEYRFSGDEVGIMQVGETVVLYDLKKAWKHFLELPPLTPDVYEAILEARQERRHPRETPEEQEA